MNFLLQNTFAKLDFMAEDKDEPHTPNSELLYSILNIEPGKRFPCFSFKTYSLSLCFYTFQCMVSIPK